MTCYTMRRCFGGKDQEPYGSQQGIKIPSFSTNEQAKEDEKNQIEGSMDENGSWSSDEQQIGGIAERYF